MESENLMETLCYFNSKLQFKKTIFPQILRLQYPFPCYIFWVPHFNLALTAVSHNSSIDLSGKRVHSLKSAETAYKNQTGTVYKQTSPLR